MIESEPEPARFGMPPVVVPTSTAQEVADAIDRPSVANYHFATTIRVPVGKRILGGGMTAEAEPEPGQPDLYLFVKPSVQELRDDLKSESPLPTSETQSEPERRAKPEKP